MTRIIFILFIMTSLSFADEYPKFFAQLGTPLYKADKAFVRLSLLDGMKGKSELYHIESQKLLHFAESLEKEPEKLAAKRKTYVKRLRALQKVHDEILRIVNANLLKSIDADDYPVFYAIIDSDIDALLDNHIIRKRVMAYYVGHRTRGKLAALDDIYATLGSDTVLKEYVKGHLPKIELIPSAYASGGSVHKTEFSKNEKLAYLADGNHCFKVIDVHNFASASEFASYEFPERECALVDITVSSDFKYIFLSDLKNGFAILDMSYAIAPLLQTAMSLLSFRTNAV
jgi:FtsZ-binding cell division protein ZapB